MIRIIQYIFSLLVCLSLSAGIYGRSVDTLPDLKTLGALGDSLFSTMFVSQDSSISNSIARKLKDYGRILGEGKRDIEEFASRSYLAEYYLVNDMYNEAYRELSQCYSIWNIIKADTSILESYTMRNVVNKMFNSLSMYYLNYESNYEKAVSCLVEGLELSKKTGNRDDYIIMGSNLVMIDFIRDNPDGIRYAQEVYEFSKESNDLFAKYSGPYGMALMHYLGGNYAEAEKYIKEALSYIGLENDKLGAYNTYANILHAKGMDKEAEANYVKAYNGISGKSNTAAIYTCLSYGSFLYDTKRYREAIDILKEGIGYDTNMGHYGFTYKLYKILALSYAGLNDWSNAYTYFTEYHRLENNVFNAKREWAINELTLKYETARKEQQIQEKEAALAKRDKALMASFLIIIITAGAAGIAYWQYVNKNRTYKKIVRQYRESMRNEAKLEERIKLLESHINNSPENEKYAMSSLTDDKKNELFEKLENLMVKDRIYHDKNITREKMADMIGTNRTYLSKVINDNTGKSFNQYIASFRIKETLQILSDPNMDIPMKALYEEVGFSSINTFYKIFKEEVGMTPSKYHEKILEIASE